MHVRNTEQSWLCRVHPDRPLNPTHVRNTERPLLCRKRSEVGAISWGMFGT